MDYDELREVHEDASLVNQLSDIYEFELPTLEEVHEDAILENTTFPNDLDFDFPLNDNPYHDEEYEEEIYLDNFKFRLPSGCHIISKEEIQESINRKDKKQNTRAI